ncbi:MULTISPECIES: hypothetical protein [unclassified Serratia (in: enterobacteria)]|uniref:hypothetical protein n=1 Tax=unclassified Serratia (in: enterobacteria) TaxID=2647522 RepID=UPI0030766F8F
MFPLGVPTPMTRPVPYMVHDAGVAGHDTPVVPITLPTETDGLIFSDDGGIIFTLACMGEVHVGIAAAGGI